MAPAGPFCEPGFRGRRRQPNRWGKSLAASRQSSRFMCNRLRAFRESIVGAPRLRKRCCGGVLALPLGNHSRFLFFEFVANMIYKPGAWGICAQMGRGLLSQSSRVDCPAGIALGGFRRRPAGAPSTASSGQSFKKAKIRNHRRPAWCGRLGGTIFRSYSHGHQGRRAKSRWPWASRWSASPTWRCNGPGGKARAEKIAGSMSPPGPGLPASSFHSLQATQHHRQPATVRHLPVQGSFDPAPACGVVRRQRFAPFPAQGAWRNLRSGGQPRQQRARFRTADLLQIGRYAFRYKERHRS